MEEYEIMKMIGSEAERQKRADEAHLRQLRGELDSDLGRWCARRRLAMRVIAMTVMIVVPGLWYASLPQRAADQVMCNQRGEEMLVLNRACAALGNCESRQVTGLLKGMNVQ